MSKIKYSISLDMHSSVSQASVAAKQGDDNRQFSITLRSGGRSYKIERGAFAVFSTTLPDGKTVIEDNCIIVDDEIIYDFTQNLTSQVGVLDIEIRLYDRNSRLVTSPTFILVVSPRAAKGETITSSNSFTALDTLYKDTSEAIQRADDAASFANSTARSIKEARDNGDFNGEDGVDGEDVNYDLVSNALKGKASGTVVTLTDISPLAHVLRVKAKGEGVDLSTASIVACGANWIPKQVSTTALGISAVVSDDDTITFSGTTTSGYNYILYQGILPAGTYTMRWNKVGLDNGRFSVYDVAALTIVGYNDCTFTTDGTKEFRIYYNVGNAGVTISGSIKPMLNTGSTALPHESYNGVATYPINADGTVEGVTSIYPTTTLMVDTEGVILDVEYNRDINKAIAELVHTSGMPRISYIDLLADKWEGSDGDYTQVVSVKGVTKNSYIEFGFSHEQLKLFSVKDVSFSITNKNGVVMVGCVGQKPTADYRLQIKITEVLIDE